MHRAIALLFVAGCGRIAFDPRSDAAGPAAIALELPDGGQFAAVAIAPGNIWYAMSTNTGVFRSADLGMSWTACAPRAGTSTGIEARSGEIVVTGAVTLASSDDCASWINTNSPRYLQGVVHLGGVFFGLGDDGLYRRGASTWTRLPTSLDGSVVRTFDGVMPTGVLLAGTDVGITRAPDGATFTTITAGLPSLQVADLSMQGTLAFAITAGAPAGISCSGDSGATWTPCATPGGYTIAIDPLNPQHVVAGVYDDMIETTDGFATETYQRRSARGLDNATILDLYYDDDGTLIAATDRGIFATQPGGVMFEPRLTGLRAWDIDTIARAGDDIYIATRGGVLHATPGAPFTISTTGMTGNTHVRGLAVGADGTVFAPGRAIWASSDRGATWRSLRDLDMLDNYYAQSIEIVGDRVFVGTGYRVLVADPPYAEWAPYLIAGQNRLARGLRYVDGTLYAGTMAGLFASSDGGETFTAVPGASAPDMLNVTLLADGGLVIGTSNGVLISDPARTSWSANLLTGRVVRGVTEYGDLLVAATDSGVSSSRDRGITWTPVPGVETTASSSTSVDREGLVVGTNRGLVRVPLP